MLATVQPPEKKCSRRQVQRLGIARKRLFGGRGLITAVISMATVDYLAGNDEERASAATYFSGLVYQHHLTLLGLPNNWLPELIQLQKPVE